MAKDIILSKPRVVRVDKNQPYTFDQRRKGDRVVVEYLGSDGEQYRKSYWVKSGAKPNILQSGTHAEIGKQLNQLFR